MIVVRTGPTADGHGDIFITTHSGGSAVAPMQFETKYEPVGPIKESAVWAEETPLRSLTWGRRQMATAGYSPEDPLRISTEGNVKKTIDNLHGLFPGQCGDLSAENFSPGWFLLENYAGTTFADLRSGLANLRRKVDSQRDGQLSFLKANAGSVMDQLDTLMTLHDRFAEDVRAVGSEPMRELQRSLHDAIVDSNGLFTDVLHRRDKADATRAALLAISRHRFLFCLPNAVEASAKRLAYDIVVNDYARAKNLYGKTEVQIFKRVLAEADQRVLEIRRELHTKIVQMPQSVEQQKKFVKALISLEEQQQNSTVADELTHVDPAWDAIEARSQFLEQTLRQTFEQFAAKDAGSGGGNSTAASSAVAASSATSTPNAKHHASRTDPNAQPNRVQFCEEICEIAAEQMPQLWRLGQAYFSGELRGLSEPKPGNFKRIILTAVEQFCAYIRVAILSGSGASGTLGFHGASSPHGNGGSTTTNHSIGPWPNNTPVAIAHFVPWLPQCLRYVRLAYATLIGIDLPGEVLDIVQKCIEQMRLYCLQTIFRKTVDKVHALERAETWRMSVPDFPGATGLPALLERRIVEMLAEGQSTCVTAELRETVLLEPQSEGWREISKRFQDCLDAFTELLERLAMQRNDGDDGDEAAAMMQMVGGSGAPAGISQLIGSTPSKMHNGIGAAAGGGCGGGGAGGVGAAAAAAADGGAGDAVAHLGGPESADRPWETVFGWEQRLLCCMANCAYAKKVFFAHLGTLFERHGYPRPKAAIDAARENVMQLFGTLLEMYVEQKSDPLVGTIEPSMYIGRFQWDAVPHTGKLRPYAHECLDNLVAVYSEIYTISPALLPVVLEPIVQTVAEELARLMQCVQKFSEYGKFQANIDIQLMRDALKNFSNDAARSFFAEALDVIPTLSRIGTAEMFEALNHIRESMRLQLMCFEVEF